MACWLLGAGAVLKDRLYHGTGAGGLIELDNGLNVVSEGLQYRFLPHAEPTRIVLVVQHLCVHI